MARRPLHPNKEIEAAVAYAEQNGWSWVKVKGHAWAKLLCAHHDREGCAVFVWSTPRNPQNHARQLRREIDRCPHREQEDSDDRI
ncbi:hypothetical protein SAMN05216374_5481 [Tardiphaga sp. OK246]|jgi:hypothetical protein|nr:hypothetical protein SAMN05216374_5481 [Tardiphaga sp. OK246]